MTTNIDLASLTTSQGFKILGADNGDSSGYSVSSAGDVNKDGYADIIIGAYNQDYNQGFGSYIIFGKSTGFSDIYLKTLTISQGFKIYGATWNGFSVSEAGDVNKDGYDDFIIGAPYNNGVSYIIFGQANFFGDIYLNTLTLTQGIKIIGENSDDYSGTSVREAGDINGDGYADVIIGAYGADPNGRNTAGTSYVIFGKASSLNEIDLSVDLVDTGQGFKILGATAGDYSGWSVSGAGDVNGDGYADVIIGASKASPNGRADAGTIYVIFGKATGLSNVDLLSLNTTQGFKILGAAANDYTGYSVSGAGDINNDGFDDIVFGAHGKNSFSGVSYIIFGKVNGFSDIDLYNGLTVAQGFKILGASSYDYSGSSVSRAGDINNDGFDDIIIGAWGADPYGRTYAGNSYVIFGKASDFSDIYLSGLNMLQGFKISGALSGDESGWSASKAGDINGDGYADVIIGAPGADPDGSSTSAGISYIIFGTPEDATLSPTNAPTTKSTITTSAPTSSPTESPTLAPTLEYLNVDITSGGTYTGTSDKEDFVVDSSQDTTITGSSGADMFTIMIHPGVNTTVTDFNEIDELINLAAFTNIHSMDDFTITSGSAIIHLDDQQKVILQNLSPSDLTENNFVFAHVPESDKDNESLSGNINGILIGAAVGGAAILCTLGYVAYAYTKHIWPFVSGVSKSSEVEFRETNLEVVSTIFAGEAGLVVEN